MMANIDPIARLLAGEVHTVTAYPDGRRIVDQPLRGAILSGSFNPLHAGHVRLLEVAATIVDLPPVFELPVLNADKGLLTAAEIERRLQQFRGKRTVVLTRAPLFREKAALFPGCVFVVGYDTAIRLVAPRYYGGVAGMQVALEAIRASGCRFLVAGREHAGQFRTLADVQVPLAFQDLFIALPEAAFRVDLSSTELRARARRAGHVDH